MSYASGNAGGIFAPSLYIGAMAGGAVGMLVHRIAPFPTGDPGAYALVGMGTLFAGIIRAPMTSVFMIFEITQDYQILVPLMVANMLSFVISRRYQPVPVYHALLQQDGVTCRQRRPLHRRRRERRVMSCAPSCRSFQRRTCSGADAWLVGNGAGHRRLPGRAHANISSAPSPASNSTSDRSSDRAREPLAALIDDSFVHAHPDHPIDVVLERLSESGGVLPVVSRTDARTGRRRHHTRKHLPLP